MSGAETSYAAMYAALQLITDKINNYYESLLNSSPSPSSTPTPFG